MSELVYTEQPDWKIPLTENGTPLPKNNYFAEMCSGSEEGSYLRLIDLCITQL